MNKYEFTFLVANESEVKNVTKIFTDHKSTISKEEKWGKQDFAYPINKATAAYYFTWMVEVPATEVSDLKNKLNFNEELIRYLLLKID